MPRLLIGIDWLDNLRLRPMPAEEIRDPTDAADDSTKKTAPSEPKPEAEGGESAPRRRDAADSSRGRDADAAWSPTCIAMATALFVYTLM